MGQQASLEEDVRISFMLEPEEGQDLKKAKQAEPDALALDFMQLYTSKKFSDVVLVIGPSKERLSVHKTVLAARSRVFEAMFFSGFKEATGAEVEIPDVDAASFKIMIEAIYTDQCKLNHGIVLAVLSCAKRYMVDSLIEMCFSFMEEELTAENACYMLEMAPHLMDSWDYAVEFIEKNAAEVVASDGWLALSSDSLSRVVQSEALALNETELFDSCLRWGRAECSRQHLPAQGPNLRKVLKDVLPFIRFPTMTCDQLASIVSPEAILSPEELLSLFVYAGAEDIREKPEVKFPTRPRRRHCDEWKLHRRYKSPAITLVDDDVRATITRTGHAWITGTKIFSKGKHAWRTHLESLSGSQWIFIGICTASARSKLSKLSFDHSTAYGISSSGQRYFGGIQRRYKLRHTTTHVDWQMGYYIDCLLDLEENTFTIMNPTTRNSWILSPLPRGEKWVPHYNIHTSGNRFRIETIEVSAFGQRS